MNNSELSELSENIKNLLNKNLDIQTEDANWAAHNDSKVLKFSGSRPSEDRPNRRTETLLICLTLEAEQDYQETLINSWLNHISKVLDNLKEQLAPEHGRYETPGVLSIFLLNDGTIKIE